MIENYRKKLKYRAYYRGCKESEVILRSFTDKYIESFVISELEMLDEILEIKDADLVPIFFGEKKIPENFLNNNVFQLLVEHLYSVKTI